MKTWQGWILHQTQGAKNKAMILGYPIQGGEEVRVRAQDRDQAARILAERLHDLCSALYFSPHDNRPVAGKTYLVWMKDH